MDASAKVRSIDALDHLGQAIRTFAQDALVAVEDVRMSVHRAIQWVQYDQKDYWTQESRRSDQKLAEARQALDRKRIARFGDEEPSCYEEKKAVEAAKRRLEMSRQKLQAVKRWTQLLERESNDCRSGIASLVDWLQTDVPRAEATLQRLTIALESYVDMSLPTTSATETSGGESSSPEKKDASDGGQPAGEAVEGNG